MPETPDHHPRSLPASVVAALADRYRIERELGQGGMATVYLAEDIRHQRKVAVKVLRPELAAVLGSESIGIPVPPDPVTFRERQWIDTRSARPPCWRCAS